MVGSLGGGGIEQKRKRTHGHRQQCVDGWGQWGIKGLNGNGKNIIKIIYSKKATVTGLCVYYVLSFYCYSGVYSLCLF